MSFSEKLKQLMRELNITQAQVCSMTGKSKASISQYLSGKQTPPKAARKKFAENLGVNGDYFEDENEIDLDAPEYQEGIQRMTVTQAARLLHVSPNVITRGLIAERYKWGYAIPNGKKRVDRMGNEKQMYTFIINKRKFMAIEMLI